MSSCFGSNEGLGQQQQVEVGHALVEGYGGLNEIEGGQEEVAPVEGYGGLNEIEGGQGEPGLAPVEGAAGGLDEVEGLIAIPPVDDTGSLADALNQDRRYVATCNKSTIKQVARMIAEFGDQLAIFDYESKRPKSPKQKVHATVSKLFKSAFETLGIILDEVEQMKRPKDLGTEEGEQRGILKFAELTFQLGIFKYLAIFVNCIDIPDGKYEVEKEHIIKSLEGIENQEEKIDQLIKTAGEILERIIKKESMDMKDAQEFDNIYSEVTLAIDSTRRKLRNVEGPLEDLLHRANTAKWLSRVARIGAMGIGCIYIYEQYKASEMRLSTALVVGATWGFWWLTLVPTNSHELHDSLRKLENNHKRLSANLEELHLRMQHKADQKEKVDQQRYKTGSVF